MSKVLLDTSAVLAFLFDEMGADKVATFLDNGLGLISSVNYAELVAILVDVEMPLPMIKEALASVELELIEFSEVHAFKSGVS